MTVTHTDMKAKILIPLLLVLSVFTLPAQDSARFHFQKAFEELSSMLEGKQPLDFERAVFITENAYRDNLIDYQDFKTTLDIHASIIGQLIKANDKGDWKKYQPVSMGIPMETDEGTKENYRKALANWAIYTYLTETTKINFLFPAESPASGLPTGQAGTLAEARQPFLHLPFTYSNDDPFGSIKWKNSQVLNLLETQKGNCYALATLFKIFSERFYSEANIVTAPQHVYIEHRDPKGDLYNVEVATRSFPGTGSIQTFTYTTREALLNNISLRSLDLKQSIGLCLVYLAKGYEHKYKTKDDDFLLACAEKTLEHDAKNLNAILLKAQVYEQRVMKKEMPSAPYEKMLAELYTLGYRQMPDDMKDIILSKIQGTQPITKPTNKTPNPFESIGEQARYVTLSAGLFEELHTPQKLVRVGQTIFNTDKNKIEKFLDTDNSSYQVDPVVFALSVDPLTKEFPWYTPYQFAGNTPIGAIDLDGAEPLWSMSDHYRYTRESYNNIYGKLEGERQYQIYKQGAATGAVTGVVGGVTLLVAPPAARWLLGNWHHVLYNPIIHNEIAAGVYGAVADDQWPIPSLTDDFTRTGRQAFKISEQVVGEFVKVKRGMSDIARKYQKQISRLPENVEFRLNNVDFDGFINGTLVEAKGLGYKGLLSSEKTRESVINNVLKEARRQVDAAGETPVRFEFAEKEAADTFRNLFKKEGLNIEVKHTPLDFKKKE
jgi:Restriction endonuclease fold toxin 5